MPSGKPESMTQVSGVHPYSEKEKVKRIFIMTVLRNLDTIRVWIEI